MRVNHNVAASYAYTAFTANQAAMQKTIRRLSTGLRVNAAADDAAGLAISEKTRAQLHGLNQALRNVQDGVSMIQTAEGGLNEIHSVLHRMRELSVQAANDVLTSQDRAYSQLEGDQLKEAIDKAAGATQFNRKKLLNGASSVLWSSDKLSTEVLVRGGLSGKDFFNQTLTAEGNYRLEITAEPGAGQVLKSSVFEVS